MAALLSRPPLTRFMWLRMREQHAHAVVVTRCVGGPFTPSSNSVLMRHSQHSISLFYNSRLMVGHFLIVILLLWTLARNLEKYSSLKWYVTDVITRKMQLKHAALKLLLDNVLTLIM